MRDVSTWPFHEQIKYHAARFAFVHRHEVCPREVDIDGRIQPITWGRWFELKFGESLDEYQRNLTERKP